MRDVPEPIDEAFYAGRRTEEVPFVINDCVRIVEGPLSGKRGAVLSVESIRPEATVRVELGEDGTDVIVPVRSLRHHETTG